MASPFYGQHIRIAGISLKRSPATERCSVPVALSRNGALHHR